MKFTLKVVAIISVASGLLNTSSARADTWVNANSYVVSGGHMLGMSAFTPLSFDDLGGGAYSSTYWRTGIAKFKFSAGDLSQRYTVTGDFATVGLGASRKVDEKTSVMVGVDAELRRQSASVEQSTNGEHISFRLNANVDRQWSKTDKLSMAFTYSPRFKSYWLGVTNAHILQPDGWYAGPQISFSGEMDYRSRGVAIVVGKAPSRKGELGGVTSLGISKASIAGSRTDPFFAISLSYGF
jgi:hypothetical protein